MRKLAAWFADRLRTLGRRLAGGGVIDAHQWGPGLPDDIEEVLAAGKPVMTATEWFSCTEPKAMLSFLRGRGSARKLRLFAVACCRRVSHLPDANPHGWAVEVAERYADGAATVAERAGARGTIGTSHLSVILAHAASADAWHAAEWGISGADLVADRAAEHAAQCHLLRDLFGDPFQAPQPVEAGVLNWGAGIVSTMARRLYEERAFDLLPILADALEDAGCDNAEFLNHCRGPGPHVRGCWALDLILGKS
jgi:hypothetical protein